MMHRLEEKRVNTIKEVNECDAQLNHLMCLLEKYANKYLST